MNRVVINTISLLSILMIGCFMQKPKSEIIKRSYYKVEKRYIDKSVSEDSAKIKGKIVELSNDSTKYLELGCYIIYSPKLGALSDENGEYELTIPIGLGSIEYKCPLNDNNVITDTINFRSKEVLEIDAFILKQKPPFNFTIP